jgi:hypothetical protein
MTAKTLDEPKTDLNNYQRPVIGTRIVKGYDGMFPYRQPPRAINRELLLANGYSAHLADKFEKGEFAIYKEGPPDNLITILELADGSRFEMTGQYLGDGTTRIAIIRQLTDAPR